MGNKLYVNGYLNYVKAEIRQVTKQLLLFFAVFCASALFIYGKVPIILGQNTSQYAYEFANADFNMWIVTLILSVVCVSAVFAGFHKRGMATQKMMLPISMCSKFSIRLLIAIVIPMAFVAIAGGMSYVFNVIYGFKSLFYLKVFLYQGDILQAMVPKFEHVVSGAAAYLFVLAIYFYGAVIWRSLHFLKTSAVLTVIGALFVLSMDIQTTFMCWLRFFDMVNKLNIWVCNAAVLMGAIAFFAASWLKFKNLQIKK